MSRRHGRVLPALVLGLLAPVGCMPWQSYMPQMVVAEHPPVASGCLGELTPAQAAQLCRMAGEALEAKGLTAEAIRQYQNARKHDPHAPGVARHLAVLYDLQGDSATAEREYLHALREQPRDAELLNDFGYFHYRHNHLPVAESWLRNAIAVDPNCACAWTNLGQVLAYQGRAEDSYQAFSQVLRPAEAYSNLGILLAKLGRTAEARVALQQAVKLEPRLMQPRAFLNALADMPGPLPPGLTHTPTPVLRMSAEKPPAALSSYAANLGETATKPVPPRQAGSGSDRSFSTIANAPGVPGLEATSKPAPPASRQSEWLTPNRISEPPALSRPPALTSRPSPASVEFPPLPIIVNGPIQPIPISVRPGSAQSWEQSSSAKMSLPPMHKTPPSPPPAPPSPPPLAPQPSAGTEGPTLIRTSAATVEPIGALTSSKAAPGPLPPMPSAIPLSRKPLPPSPRTTTPPQAVLTDCQGEHKPEPDPE